MNEEYYEVHHEVVPRSSQSWIKIVLSQDAYCVKEW